MKVFLGGEGPDELGTWASEVPYVDPRAEPGVIEALLQKVQPDGWRIVGGLRWSRIRKYRRGRELAAAEVQNVMGLALDAADAGCDVLIFVRDRDRSEERQRDVEAGIVRAAERFSTLRVAGGMAIEELEAWLLALLGERGCEAHGDAKRVLAQRHKVTAREDKVAIVENADLGRLPEDAASLRLWLDRARAALRGASE